VSYSRRHYRLIANGGPDTAAVIAERIRAREISEQVDRERDARFGAITAENADAVIKWQAARLAELRRGSK
jgi:hypothetical protein